MVVMCVIFGFIFSEGTFLNIKIYISYFDCVDLVLQKYSFLTKVTLLSEHICMGISVYVNQISILQRRF